MKLTQQLSPRTRTHWKGRDHSASRVNLQGAFLCRRFRAGGKAMCIKLRVRGIWKRF